MVYKTAAVFGILGACLAVAACATSPPSERARGVAAIRAVLEEDRALGARRNRAPESGSLAAAVRAYVEGLDAIDFGDCPADFTEAFTLHRDAWHRSIGFFAEHGDLRGELHELFDEIRESSPDARERLEGHEGAIRDTWADVEAAVARNGAGPS